MRKTSAQILAILMGTMIGVGGVAAPVCQPKHLGGGGLCAGIGPGQFGPGHLIALRSL